LKVKTRVAPQGGSNDEVMQRQMPETTLASRPSESFTVDERAYKAFIALFHEPKSPSRPGEVAWQNILYAMSVTGFMFEKLYGSV
jgi:hypothetical protein